MWIESHQSLLNHRKTGRLSRRLGISRVTAIGYLHILWWWCLDNAPEGDLTGIDVEDISQGACWEGEPADFLESLIYAEFVDRTDDGRTIVHDWHEFAGKLIERRKSDAARKRESRQSQDIPQNSNGHPTDSVRTACVPNLTVPNSTEQYSTENAGAVAPSAPTPARKSPSSQKAKGERLPDDWEPRGDDILQMERECPGVDLTRSTAKFRDYFLGEGTVKVNWFSTWKNWVRRDYERQAVVPSRASPAAAPKPLTPRQEAVATSVERSEEFFADIAAGKLPDLTAVTHRAMRRAGLDPTLPGDPPTTSVPPGRDRNAIETVKPKEVVYRALRPDERLH